MLKNLNVFAFVIALVTGVLAFLQGFFMLMIGTITASVPEFMEFIGRMQGMMPYGYAPISSMIENAASGFIWAGLLITSAAIIGIVGGSFALKHKKVSCVLLIVSVVLSVIALMPASGARLTVIIEIVGYVVAVLIAFVDREEDTLEKINNININAPVATPEQLKQIRDSVLKGVVQFIKNKQEQAKTSSTTPTEHPKTATAN